MAAVAAVAAGGMPPPPPPGGGGRQLPPAMADAPAEDLRQCRGCKRRLPLSEFVNPRETAPLAVLIKFNSYGGPACFDDPDLAGVVPIFRSKRDFLRGNSNCTRTQFPLTIAYAITVHKSQGATLEKAVLDISERDFQPGLSYVAVSRVKSLQGVMFDNSFDLSALRGQSNVNSEARAEDIRRRAPQRVTADQVAGIVGGGRNVDM